MGYSNGIIIYKNIIILYIYGERRNSDGIKCFCNDLIGQNDSIIGYNYGLKENYDNSSIELLYNRVL